MIEYWISWSKMSKNFASGGLRPGGRIFEFYWKNHENPVTRKKTKKNTVLKECFFFSGQTYRVSYNPDGFVDTVTSVQFVASSEDGVCISSVTFNGGRNPLVPANPYWLDSKCESAGCNCGEYSIAAVIFQVLFFFFLFTGKTHRIIVQFVV